MWDIKPRNLSTMPYGEAMQYMLKIGDFSTKTGRKIYVQYDTGGPVDTGDAVTVLPYEDEYLSTCEWNGDCRDSEYPEKCAPCIEDYWDGYAQMAEDRYRDR